jgi:hypothetical protein
MSRRKPLAALAAVTSALALAVPATSASASPAAPVRTASIVRLVPGSAACWGLIYQIRTALLFNNTPWANIASNAFVYSGCGGAAI